MKKMLVVWLIFASKLLGSFLMSAIYTPFSSIYATERQAVVTRDAGTGVHDGGTTPLTYERGGNGVTDALT